MVNDTELLDVVGLLAVVELMVVVGLLVDIGHLELAVVTDGWELVVAGVDSKGLAVVEE